MIQVLFFRIRHKPNEKIAVLKDWSCLSALVLCIVPTTICSGRSHKAQRLPRCCSISANEKSSTIAVVEPCANSRPAHQPFRRRMEASRWLMDRVFVRPQGRSRKTKGPKSSTQRVDCCCSSWNATKGKMTTLGRESVV